MGTSLRSERHASYRQGSARKQVGSPGITARNADASKDNILHKRIIRFLIINIHVYIMGKIQ